MAVSVSCPTCAEKLDDRDVVKDSKIVCWKCGWRDTIMLDDEDEWVDKLFNVWLPYD